MIEANSITKRFGQITAIDDLSFQIRPGEVVGLLGPNGAGKTTTMRILTGFMPPSAGRVTVAGHDLLEDPKKAKRHLGYLPEHPPLYPELTVEETLRFVAGLQGVPKKKRSEQIDRALEQTGLTDIRKRLVGNVSKGYRQRIGIAQAIVHDPLFLILDEPTIGLDPKQILEIRELIHNLKGQRAILLSSHILQEVSLVCDRVIIIHKGRIVADGSIDSLASSMTTTKKRYLVTVEKGNQDMKQEIAALQGVESVEEYASDLEALFLQLTEDTHVVPH